MEKKKYEWHSKNLKNNATTTLHNKTMLKKYLGLVILLSSFLVTGNVYGEEHKSSWACMTKKFFQYQPYMGDRVNLFDTIQFFLTIKQDSVSYTSKRASLPNMTSGTLKIDKTMPNNLKTSSAPLGFAYDNYSFLKFSPGGLFDLGKKNLFFNWVFVFLHDRSPHTINLMGECVKADFPQ
jgi:hypothetical protein